MIWRKAIMRLLFCREFVIIHHANYDGRIKLGCMFNIGFEELILILLVAFVFVGPKDLPKVARAIGRFVKMVKQMFEDFKEETGLDETLSELEDTSRDLTKTIREADPRADIKDAQRDLKDAQRNLHEALKDVEKLTKSGLENKAKK